MLSSQVLSWILQFLVLFASLPHAHSGRKNLPQGDQSTLLCRCQTVHEDLYAGKDRPHRGQRSLLLGVGGPPREFVVATGRMNPNYRSTELDRNGYIIVDGLTVLPDTRPVCKETRQRKRAAGVRNLLDSDEEDDLSVDSDDTLQDDSETEQDDFVDEAESEQLRLLRPRKLISERDLKGSKGEGKGKGGGSKGGGMGMGKGGGSKGGSDDWSWGGGKGKGGSKGGSKGGGSKGGGSKGGSKGMKGGSKSKGKGKGGNNIWRPPVFPCPRPPNNDRPTRAPRKTIEPTLTTAPTPVPSSKIIVPTASPLPTIPTPLQPTVPTPGPTLVGTAEPTASLSPTGGSTTPGPTITGTAEPTASLQPTGGGGTPAPSILGTNQPTVSPQPSAFGTDFPTAGGTGEPTASPQPSGLGTPTPSVFTVVPTVTPQPSVITTLEPTTSPQPSGITTVVPTATSQPNSITTSEPTTSPQPTILSTLEPTASQQPTTVNSGTGQPSATSLQPTPLTVQPTVSPGPTPLITTVPTVTAAPSTSESPTITPGPTITSQPTNGPTITSAPSTSAAPTVVILQRAFNVLEEFGLPLLKSSSDASCEVSLGIHCATSQGRACSEMYYPPTSVCPATTSVLSLQFDPDTCEFDSTNHTGVTCTDYFPIVDGQFLLQCTAGNVALKIDPIIVSPGDVATVQSADPSVALPTKFECTVTDSNGKKAQTIGFNAGASVAAVNLKRRAGSLTVVGCDDLQCLETIRYRYEVSNVGDTSMTLSSLTLRENGGLSVEEDLTSKLISPRVGPGEVTTVEESQDIDICVLRDYELTVRVNAHPYPDNGKVCQAQFNFKLEIGPPPSTS